MSYVIQSHEERGDGRTQRLGPALGAAQAASGRPIGRSSAQSHRRVKLSRLLVRHGLLLHRWVSRVRHQQA